MSFHQKSAISMLTIMVLVFGWYFLKVYNMSLAGPVEMAAVSTLLFGMVIGIVVLSIMAHILIAIPASHGEQGAIDESDERDRLINVRGNSKSSHVLGVGVVISLGMALLEIPVFYIAHALFAALVLSEISKLLFKVIDYRRGI